MHRVADSSGKPGAISFSHLWLGWEMLTVVNILFQTVNFRRYDSGDVQGASICGNEGSFIKRCFIVLTFVWLLFNGVSYLKGVRVQAPIPRCLFSSG